MKILYSHEEAGLLKILDNVFDIFTNFWCLVVSRYPVLDMRSPATKRPFLMKNVLRKNIGRPSRRLSLKHFYSSAIEERYILVDEILSWHEICVDSHYELTMKFEVKSIKEISDTFPP